MRNKILSIIVPVFNEEENIELLIKELFPVLQKTALFSHYEIILINDGSTDNSWGKIKEASYNSPHIKGISFTRNFGQAYAFLAGMRVCSGDALVFIDADLQDPPELILEFEREWGNGYDIIYGIRTQRLEESFLKKFTSKLFTLFFRSLTNVDLPSNSGEFCLLSRKAINILNSLPEKSIYMRTLIHWPGLSKKGIPFIRQKRNKGITKYNYYKLMILGLEYIISFSITPIYYLIFFSSFLMFMCGLGISTTLFMRFFGKVIMTGWASLMICILFLFSCTFFILGILGLYIGKIFQEVKGRPEFIINERCGFKVQDEASPSLPCITPSKKGSSKTRQI